MSKTARVGLSTLYEMKRTGRKIGAVVTYSYTMARLADAAGVDVILVGDSVARVVSGFPNHTPVKLEEMIYHTRAVSRACERALVMADLPERALVGGSMLAAERAFALIGDGGAACVKVEGITDYVKETVHCIAQAGIPVVAHLTMPPSRVHRSGQSSSEEQNPGAARTDLKEMVSLAQDFETAGSCLILLARVDPDAAAAVTQTVSVPTIGIGAGPSCDGQILVLEDLLGLTWRDHPYYMKQYAHLADDSVEAIRSYLDQVRDGTFPGEKQSHPNHDQAGRV